MVVIIATVTVGMQGEETKSCPFLVFGRSAESADECYTCPHFVSFRMYRKNYHMVGLTYPAAVIVTLKVKEFQLFFFVK
jgi:hypothetical protein